MDKRWKVWKKEWRNVGHVWRWWMASKNGMFQPTTWDRMVSKEKCDPVCLRSKDVCTPTLPCYNTIISHVSKFTTFRFCHNYDLQLLCCQAVLTRFLPKRHFDSTLPSSKVKRCNKLRRLTQQIVHIRLSLLAPSRAVKCILYVTIRYQYYIGSWYINI